MDCLWSGKTGLQGRHSRSTRYELSYLVMLSLWLSPFSELSPIFRNCSFTIHCYRSNRAQQSHLGTFSDRTLVRFCGNETKGGVKCLSQAMGSIRVDSNLPGKVRRLARAHVIQEVALNIRVALLGERRIAITGISTGLSVSCQLRRR